MNNKMIEKYNEYILKTKQSKISKLEEKLMMLGYTKLYNNIYEKDFSKWNFEIRINIAKFPYLGFICPNSLYFIETQKHIDILQQAFNEMTNDLNILRKLDLVE